MLSQNTTAQATGIKIGASQRIVAALIAGLLGSSMLYVVAFANSDILHNAAHDTRHSITAPCH